MTLAFLTNFLEPHQCVLSAKTEDLVTIFDVANCNVKKSCEIMMSLLLCIQSQLFFTLNNCVLFSFSDPLSKVDIVPKQDAYNAGEMIKCIADGNPAPKITFQPSGIVEMGDGWTSLIIKEEWVGKKQEIM